MQGKRAGEMNLEEECISFFQLKTSLEYSVACGSSSPCLGMGKRQCEKVLSKNINQGNMEKQHLME
jgi:hypothetical protein